MLGTHLLKCWSSIQAGVAMSSGEAEFYGAVKGASIGLGLKALYRDIGYTMPLRLWTDSSAAVGIRNRQGLGKLRHLECTSLWIQQRIWHGELEVRKIADEENPVDLYTKHIESEAKIEQLVKLFGGEFRGGRAEAAPHLKQDPTTVGMVEALISDSAEQPECRPDTSMLPHLMPRDEIDKCFPIVRLDEGENQWAHALEGGITRPSEELSDPGPRGKLEFVPAMHEAGVLVVEDDKDVGESGGGATQGMGAAQG
jgi:hypothetical protein